MTSTTLGRLTCIERDCTNLAQDAGRCSTHNRQRRYGLSEPNGKLAVNCWCEQSIVFMRPEDIWQGRTRSCGKKDCKPR